MKTIPVSNVKSHILAWSIFIAYEVLISLPLNGWRFANFWDYTVHYILHIALFYFNAHVALPWAMAKSRKRYWFYSVLVVLQLCVYIGIKYVILYLFNFFKIPLSPAFLNNADYLLNGIFRAFYFLGFSTAYWFALTTLRNRKTIAELENSQLKDKINKNALESAIISTENAYLKSQINPHFLFNTLNFLYNSVSKFSPAIAESVMSLSDTMRYALTAADDDGKVRLALEVDHIENFIKLNQARFSQKLCINFKVTGEIADQRIIPLILLTLVENVFKYGVLNDPSSPANITLAATADELQFVTENLKRKRNNAVSYGIGIKNMKSRLAAYHRFDLEIEDDGELYKSVLTIWF